jgi:hypothetical protein
MKWKYIPGYNKRYKIYKDGRIWSRRSKRFLKEQTDHYGYRYYILCIDSKLKNKTTHRWLWESFVGAVPKGKQINHIDGNKLNNSLDNLELSTPKENIQHAWRMGLCRRSLGSKTNNSKLLECDIAKIFRLHKRGLSQCKIAKKFSVTQSNISRILNKQTWRHA